MLERAGMTVADLVKVTQYLTRAEDVPAYVKVRSRFLGDARPVFMLVDEQLRTTAAGVWMVGWKASPLSSSRLPRDPADSVN